MPLVERPRRPVNSLGVIAEAVLPRYQNETSFRSLGCGCEDSVPTAVREGAEEESEVSILTSVMLRI